MEKLMLNESSDLNVAINIKIRLTCIDGLDGTRALYDVKVVHDGKLRKTILFVYGVGLVVTPV